MLKTKSLIQHVSSYYFAIIAAILFTVNIIQVQSQCPGYYPNICWQDFSLPNPTNPSAEYLAASDLPSLVRHSMVFVPPSSFFIYGGLDSTSNNLKNDVWRIIAIAPVPPGTSTWTISQVSLVDSNPPFDLKARMDHSMVAYRESDAEYSLYVYGGIGDVRLKDLWRFNTNTRVWTQMGEPPGTLGYLFGHTAVMITELSMAGITYQSSRMWVFGGTNQVNEIQSELHIYDFPNNNEVTTDSAWTMNVALTPKPIAVTQHCAAQVHDFCMYIYGGVISYSPFTPTNQLWEYCGSNPADGTWVNPRPLGWTQYTPVTTAITPVGRLTRYGHACTGVGDRLLVFGGRPNIDQPNYANDLIDYDPVLNRWGNVVTNVMFNNSINSPPAIREEFATAFFNYNDDYYSIFHGGLGPSSTHTDMWSINYRRPKCIAGYYSTLGTVDCLPCSAGYISEEGAYNCTQCLAGEYTNGIGDWECHECPAGTYTLIFPAIEMDNCTKCSLGTYSNITGRNVVCDECPPGTYSTNFVGMTQCTLCPEGTGNPDPGKIFEEDCYECNAGFYAPEGSVGCFPCDAGYFSSISRQANCTPCASGTWSDQQATSCSNCPAGTTNNATGSAGLASCLDCPAGTYAPNPGTPYCLECLPGTYSTTIGATSDSTCISCPIGTYSNVSGAPDVSYCFSCPAGTYQSSPGSSDCSLCPKGTYNDVPGATDIDACLPCPAGSYASEEGTVSADECLSCPTGEYQPNTGQESCLPCPHGTYNPNIRVDSIDGCLPCLPDTYSLERSNSCIPCGYSPGDVIGDVVSNSSRYYYSMMGWETCISCDIGTNGEFGYGWVKNGHFSHDPVHGFWIPDPSNTGTCTWTMSSGTLNLLTSSTTSSCTYQQTFNLYTISTFPFHFSAKMRPTVSMTLGSGAYIRANFEITLQNGTIQDFPLNFDTSSFGTWQEREDSHIPDQFNDKNFLENLYIIDHVKISLSVYRVQGNFQWDDITFSPYSSNMCNCSKVNRESQYFTIDLFERYSCEHCNIGKYCNGAGQFQCSDNTYSFGGYNYCMRCSKGLACKDGIATTCESTQFKNETSNECEDCPLDSSCRNTDRHICEPGTYGQGSKHCLACVPGTFCNHDGCTSCEICEPGTASNFMRTYCYECLPGHYSPDGVACIECPSGTYSNSTGSSECISCPNELPTTCTGATDIFFCKQD